MRPTIHTVPKLQVHRETLRELSVADLRIVVGGTTNTNAGTAGLRLR